MHLVRLGRKLLLLAVAAALLYCGTLILIFAALNTSGFIELEATFMRNDLSRAANFIDSRGLAIASTAADDARWDESRAWVQGLKPGFMEENFPDDVLESLGLSFVAYYRDDGGLAGIRALDAMPPLSLAKHLDHGDAFLDDAGFTGLRRLGEIPCVVASRPVTSSDGKAPPLGHIVLGRALDQAFLATANANLGLALEAGKPEGGALGFEPQRLSTSDAYVLPDAKANLVRGFLLLRDQAGEPLLVIRSQSPRTIMAEAHHIRLAIVLASPILLVFVIGAGWLAFRILLLAPLERLERILDSESRGAATAAMDGELLSITKREDAIGRMATFLLAARERLREGSDTIAVVNERLENEVAARTTELRRANHNLRLYRKIMEGTSEGVVITDLSGTILEANDAFCGISGFEREDFLGKNPRVLKSDRHDAAFYAAMWKSMLEKGQWSGEVWDRRKNGEVYPKWLSINTIYDDEGKPTGYVGLSADISRIKEAEERLSRMVFYDSLTSLPNRALFRDRLAQSILRAERSLSRCALLFMDLDRFKNVNDSLGHLAGDELLIQVSRRILAQVRDSDTVCRLGGDEFTIVLDDVPRSEVAGEVAAKIIRAIRKPFMLGDNEVYVGASIGIALFPFDGTDEETLIKKADAAMYEAKEGGRGQFRFAAGRAGADSQRRISVEGELRRALDQGLFKLYYQPQVAAGAARAGSNAGLMGAEALIRMKRPDGAIVSPGEFIDVAEDSGIIIAMGEWAIGEACREAARWAAAGKPLVVSVNVSPRQFERGDLAAVVGAALAESALAPRLLKLEVTESLFMRKMERSIEIMNEIRELGVVFAVDDFGIGFSSLQYLHRLPLDYLKIDKAFVDDIVDEFEGGEIVTAVIALSRAFGLSCIAEGVENEAQMEALKRRGCDEFQGYLISRPLDAEAFMRFALAEGGEGLPADGAGEGAGEGAG